MKLLSHVLLAQVPLEPRPPDSQFDGPHVGVVRHRSSFTRFRTDLNDNGRRVSGAGYPIRVKFC